MMRIGAGIFRGRVLRTPRGEATRPTSGMVRETLGNMLAPELPGARFLDLYAGCGSVGLEALSRGAEHAAFVESGRAALACLRGNIQLLGVEAQAEVLPLPAEKALAQLAAAGRQFDLIFLDPPFADAAAYRQVLDLVDAGRLLASEGLLIAQHDVRTPPPESAGALRQVRTRKIGDNALAFYRREG